MHKLKIFASLFVYRITLNITEYLYRYLWRNNYRTFHDLSPGDHFFKINNRCIYVYLYRSKFFAHYSALGEHIIYTLPINTIIKPL